MFILTSFCQYKPSGAHPQLAAEKKEIDDS